MTRRENSAHTLRMGRRPKEWETWQGRLVWMIDRVVPSEMKMRELSRRCELPESSLSVQVPRLRVGGDLQFSTLLALHRVLGFSWEWLAENKGWPTEEIRRRMGGSAPPMRAV